MIGLIVLCSQSVRHSFSSCELEGKQNTLYKKGVWSTIDSHSSSVKSEEVRPRASSRASSTAKLLLHVIQITNLQSMRRHACRTSSGVKSSTGEL